MRELLLEIWASIRRNKLRTFLTGFSVAWGIFMLVILLGSGNGLKNGTLSNFGSMAVNSVIINGGWTSQPYKGYDKWRRINITNRDLEILRTEFPEVDKVSARVQGPGQYNLSHGRDFLNNAAVVGSDPEYREIMNVRVLDGRFLNDTDLRERRKVIVVDKNVRDVLFHGQSPVGQHLLVNGTSYSIIGVFEMDQFGSYTFTFIPLTTAQLLFNHSDPSVGQTYLSVKDIDTDQKMAEFEQRLRNRLAAEHTFAPDDESAVWIYNRMEGYKNMMLVFGGINLFIWIIGLGTLLAGIVGVSNIMLVTVQERTFEFGIRKALGAKPSSIIRLILTESVMITAAFGYIGMVLGVFAMEGVNKLMTQTPPGEENTFNIFVNPTLNLSVAVSATIVLVLAGLIAGYIPSRRAARLKTVDALRHNKYPTRKPQRPGQKIKGAATTGSEKRKKTQRPGTTSREKDKETPATPVRNHPGVRRTTKVPSRGGDSGKDKIGTRGSAAKLQPKGTKRATKNREQDKEAAELRRTAKVPSRGRDLEVGKINTRVVAQLRPTEKKIRKR